MTAAGLHASQAQGPPRLSASAKLATGCAGWAAHQDMRMADCSNLDRALMGSGPERESSHVDTCKQDTACSLAEQQHAGATRAKRGRRCGGRIVNMLGVREHSGITAPHCLGLDQLQAARGGAVQGCH